MHKRSLNGGYMNNCLKKILIFILNTWCIRIGAAETEALSLKTKIFKKYYAIAQNAQILHIPTDTVGLPASAYVSVLFTKEFSHPQAKRELIELGINEPSQDQIKCVLQDEYFMGSHLGLLLLAKLYKSNYDVTPFLNNHALILRSRKTILPILKRINPALLNKLILNINFIEKDPTIIRDLVAEGADINAQWYGDSTLLHIATIAGNPIIVREAIQAKAHVNRHDIDNKTPLAYAYNALYKNRTPATIQIVSLLRQAGAHT